MEKISNKRVKYFRCDRGKEFLNTNLTPWLEAKGISVEPTCVESNASNGVAERAHRTIFDRVRATLVATNQPRLLWPLIVDHVVVAMNVIPFRNNQSPHELIFGRKPSVSNLRPFGAKAVTWIPEQQRSDKLQPRGQEGYHVGYVPNSTSLYKVRRASNNA